jgi:hypothetical protein
MRKHALFTVCATALLCSNAFASAAPQAHTPERYWYDGEIKKPLYPLYGQPQFQRKQARHAHEANDPSVARTQAASDERGQRASNVYATEPHLGNGRLMRQGPGILFILADGVSADRVHAWLRARGFAAEPIADGIAHKVGAVRGDRALELANALYESGLVRYAQPNWVMDIGTAP